MSETASSAGRRDNRAELARKLVAGLIRAGNVVDQDKEKILPNIHITELYGVPVLTLERDEVLFVLHAGLERTMFTLAVDSGTGNMKLGIRTIRFFSENGAGGKKGSKKSIYQ